MKILVVGAGAVGGYFGGRLAAAGRDVTFLVRPGRAAQLEKTGGLVILSPKGNVTVGEPSLVRSGWLDETFDLVILASKAGALESCIDDMTPAVGPYTMILPLLNGMRHIDMLSERFGRERVLGGRALIFSTLDKDGRIIHQAEGHAIDFGELDGGTSQRVEELAKVMSDAGFTARLRNDILRDLWLKWVMIATTAGGTGLFRASLGDIIRAGGKNFMLALLRENAEVAALNGFRPDEEFLAQLTATITNPDLFQMASLAKDMDKGNPIEADHIFGDFLSRIPADKRDEFPCLKTIYISLKAYEARRQRVGN